MGTIKMSCEQKYVKDKEDLKQLRKQVEESAKHVPGDSLPELVIKTITEHLPVPFWIKDKRGAYLFVNRTWEKEFGAKLENILYLVDEQIWQNIEEARHYRENDKWVLESREELITVEVVSDKKTRYPVDWVVRKFPIYWKGKGDEPVKVGGFAIKLVTLRNVKAIKDLL